MTPTAMRRRHANANGERLARAGGGMPLNQRGRWQPPEVTHRFPGGGDAPWATRTSRWLGEVESSLAGIHSDQTAVATLGDENPAAEWVWVTRELAEARRLPPRPKPRDNLGEMATRGHPPVPRSSQPRIAVRQALINAMPPFIAETTLMFGISMLEVAVPDVHGLGAQPPAPEWGAMLAEGRASTRTNGWLGAFPGLTIMVSVLGFNLVDDTLHDFLDPTLRGR